MIVNQDSLETGPQIEKFRALKKASKNGRKIPDLKRLRNPPSDTNFLARFTRPDYAPNQFIVES